MSDWCKLYSTDLLSLAWAMDEQHEVGILYITLLVRCCRERTGILPWSGKDHELFTLASEAKLRPPIVNQCIGLLERIDKIIIDSTKGTLTVRGWKERQSDYLNRKPYYQKRYKSPKSPYFTVKHSEAQCFTVKHCLEESRGEENRLESDLPQLSDTLPPHVPKVAAFRKPSLEEVKLYCAKIGLPETEGESFRDYYEANGWRVGKVPMKSWEAAMRNWRKNWQAKSYRPNGVSKPLSIYEMKTALDMKERLAEELKRKHTAQYADGVRWDDQAKRQQYMALRIEVKDLAARIGASA